jgi:hypothetical protein
MEKYMKNIYYLIPLLLVFLLSSCNTASPATVDAVIPTSTPTIEFVQPTSTMSALPSPQPTTLPNSPSAKSQSTQQLVLDRAFEVIAALKDQDWAALSGYVHPQMGLRFSPYAFVRDTDQVFPVDIIPNLLADKRLYTWGSFDGSGAPIDLSFAGYYSQFVYDVDFANPTQMALNDRLGVSNSLDNSAEFYPGAMIVEFHFPGFDPQYQGMDWRSLRLVFMEDNNTWYLVGIIHDQWTT